MLALYPEEQERLHQQVKGVMADLDGMPVGLIIPCFKCTEELNSRRPMKT